MKTHCPTAGQTETRYRQIRKNAHRFKYAEEGTNIISKTPHQMSLFIKQYRYTSTSRKRVKINSNKIALPSAQQEHHQNRIQNRIRNK